MLNEIHSYAALQQQIHKDLRVQHPEWVELNGNCPTCDSYESRLAELLRPNAELAINGQLTAHVRARFRSVQIRTDAPC